MKRVLATSVLGVCIAACGGKSTTAPTPVRTVFATGQTALVAPDAQGNAQFADVPFTTSAVGTLEATVDWTFPTNTIWVFLASGSCTVPQFQQCPGPGCQCQFAVSSMTSAPKPRVLTVPGAAAGNYALIIWNLGPREESVNYQLALTR